MKIKIALLLALCCLLLCACGQPAAAQRPAEEPKDFQSMGGSYPTIDGERPLICLADSLEQAQQIARLYGIELVDYTEGLACFYTEAEPETVIAQGMEQGWPELSLNEVVSVS